MERYPQRPRYFANKVSRLMAKSCAAQEIGADACWLVTVIAQTEDVKRYTAPVTYFNEQLQSVCGFASYGKLRRARDRAIGLGWLHYEPGGKGKPGIYWSTVPAQTSTLDDSPTDEGDDFPIHERQETDRKTTGKRQETEEETVSTSNMEEQATGNGQETDRKWRRKRSSFNPTPYPIPIPEEEEGEKFALSADADPPSKTEATQAMREVVDAWNKLPDVPPCLTLTENRSKSLRARLRDSAWRANWRKAMERVRGSPFCRGENERGWRMSFEFFIRPDSVTKILEGVYDGGNTRPGRRVGAGQRFDEQSKHADPDAGKF